MERLGKTITRFIQVLGLLLLVWGLVSNDLAWAGHELSPLRFVPRQATWMVTLTQPLHKVSPQIRPMVSEFFERQWDGLGLGRAGGSLLGLDAGLTLVNISPISEKTAQPVWIIPIKDAATTEKALTKLWEKLEITPLVEQFQGIEIFTPGLELATPQIALGIVGQSYLFVSPSAQALKESFIAAQSVDNSLLGANFYRTANLNLTRDNWGLSYLNLGAWSQVAQTGDAISPDRLFLQWENIKKPVSGLGIGTTLISSNLAPNSPAPTATKLNVSIPKLFPSDPAAVWVGHNFPAIWGQLSELLTGYGAGQPFLVQTLQALSRHLGINLKTEIEPWLTGDFGLAIFPRSSENNSQVSWHWQLTTPTNATVTAGLETLETSLRNQGWLKTPREFEAITAQAWSSTADAPPTFIQAQDQAFTTLATEMTELHPSGVEAQTPAWQPLLTRDSPDMLLHLDWATHQQAWQTTFPLLKVLKVSAPSLFENLDGITWLGLGQQGKVSRGEVILAWGK